MAKDYYRYNILDDFEIRVIQANPTHYPTGITGYEAYYIDIQGFWRQLYNPEIANQLKAALEELNGVFDENDKLIQDGLTQILEKKQDELKVKKLEVSEAENIVKSMQETNPD